jgi:glycosyltransferase involved in cell wall biosynthesis
MEYKSFSVIIPTYDRESLYGTLSSLSMQDYPSDKIETLVIDDGERKIARDICLNFSGKLNIKYLEIKHSGPAKARNLGIKNAAKEIILFLGDDIIADRNLIKTHFFSHMERKAENQGILGRVTWYEKLKITPFMLWLENGGPQFDFASLKNAQKTDYRHFYTCNISIKRAFILKYNFYFNENFIYAAYEDSELGYRMEKKNFELYYYSEALGYHNHHISARSYKERMKQVGISRHILDSSISFKSKTEISLLHYAYKLIKAYLYYSLSLICEKRFYCPKIFLGFTEGFYSIGFYGKKYKK